MSRTLFAATAVLTLSASSFAMACEWHGSAQVSSAGSPAQLESFVATHDSSSTDHSGHGHGDHNHDDMAMDEMTMDDMVMAGDLHLSGFFIRETPPMTRAAGGFMVIENTGGDDRLVAATSPLTERVELHTMTMEDDVMRMRMLPDGIEVPAGETVNLQPGGLHVMFMDMESGLSAGESVTVTLEFEEAGLVEVTFPVVARSADDMMMNHDHGDGHDGHSGTMN